MHNAARLAGIRRMLIKCDHVVAIGCPRVDQSATPSVLLHTENLPIEVERLFCISNCEVDMRQSISPYHGSLPLQHVRVYPAGEKSGASGPTRRDPDTRAKLLMRPLVVETDTLDCDVASRQIVTKLAQRILEKYKEEKRRTV